MSPLAIGIIFFIILLATVLTFRIPLAIAMGFIGFLGLVYVAGTEAAFGVLKTVPYRTTASYLLSVVPLFVLMGDFASRGGMTKELYDAAYRWLGRFPGGLAMTTIAACAGFGAICGSSGAGAATMGRIAIPEMRRYKYADSLAGATVASGGTLAILIPPSIAFILYSAITEVSVGQLFIAGIFPGILLSLLFIFVIYIVARRNPRMAPRGASFSFKEMMLALRETWAVILVFMFIMGGIYAGFFTATEAGAIGAFGVGVICLARRQIGWKELGSALVTTGRITGMIMLLITGAMIFMYFLSITRLPFKLADMILGWHVNRYIIYAAIVLIYIILGCIMDILSALLITLPIIYPIIVALHFDPIWFGIISTITGEMGLITPPVGLNVFILSGVFDDLPVWTIYRGVLPFVVAMALCILILTIFPQIATFLPSLMIK